MTGFENTHLKAALTLADDVVLDRHHLEFMPLASTRSGTFPQRFK
jgi:hypothetical protein